ncbi:MAG: hypothetical protein L3J79_11030 [Candidatus Marinimicrobia bacterium]|nr:hypothetical protein [Candidatus Neomarinimicrobiota bacterium]
MSKNRFVRRVMAVVSIALPVFITLPYSMADEFEPMEKKAESGVLATMSSREFIARYIPPRVPGQVVRAQDFLKGNSHTEAIEAALSSVSNGTPVILILDQQSWIIDRAICLPSHTELLIIDCMLKLADGVFDNIIRVAGIQPDPANPYGFCEVQPTENIRITGLKGAVIEGADHPYEGKNPKTGKITKWVGDFYGWRTVGILLSHTKGYEISGFTLRKTHGWAISQGQCSQGYLHDIVFETQVKNGDGIDFRNGCSFALVENISGHTSDDTVAMTALNGSYFTPQSNYVYPLQPEGLDFEGDAADIHDIAVRNIQTSGRHHAVICLATSPKVYNISIHHVIDEMPSTRESVVKIYSGYGSGYVEGNLSNITVSHVISKGAKYAVQVTTQVKDVSFSDIQQMKKGAETYAISEGSENLTIFKKDQ